MKITIQCKHVHVHKRWSCSNGATNVVIKTSENNISGSCSSIQKPAIIRVLVVVVAVVSTILLQFLAQAPRATRIPRIVGVVHVVYVLFVYALFDGTSSPLPQTLTKCTSIVKMSFFFKRKTMPILLITHQITTRIPYRRLVAAA